MWPHQMQGAVADERSTRARFGALYRTRKSNVCAAAQDCIANASELCAEFVHETEKNIRVGVLESRLAQEEYHTWRLIKEYLEFKSDGSVETSQAMVANSDEDLLHSHRRRDRKFDWMNRVLMWVEQTADKPRRQDAQRTHYEWNTRRDGMDMETFISKLDPDACSRERRQIPKRDQDMEDKFLRFVWMYLRAGHLDECQELCQASKQSWRAATLQGCVTGIGDTHGGPNRPCWRKACLQLAKDEQSPEYERAIYGVLSANVDEGLGVFVPRGDKRMGVIETWYDKLFVWAKLTVDQKSDEVLSRSKIPPSSMGNRELEQNFEKFMGSSSVIVTRQDALPERVQRDYPDSDVRSMLEAAISFFETVQRRIIFSAHETVQLHEQDLDPLFCSAGDNENALCHDITSQILRCALHMDLLLGSVHVGHAFSNVVHGRYINQLASLARQAEDQDPEQQDLKLAACYTQGLSKPDERQVLTNVLESLSTEQRRVVVSSIQELDSPTAMDQVQREVVRNIVKGDNRDEGKLVDVFRWALGTQNTGVLSRVNGLRYLNAHLRESMKTHQYEKEGAEGYGEQNVLCLPIRECYAVLDEDIRYAVGDLMGTFPRTVVEFQQNITETIPTKEDTAEERDFSFGECNNDIKEFHCWELFVDSQAEVSRLMELQDAGPVTEVERQRSARVQYNATVTALFKIVSMHGHWMKDDIRLPQLIAEDQATNLRNTDLATIRKMCLPRVCFQLLKFLREQEDYNACVNLIEIIADEDTPVYKDFDPRSMQYLLNEVPELLLSLAASSPDDLSAEEKLRQKGLNQLFKEALD